MRNSRILGAVLVWGLALLTLGGGALRAAAAETSPLIVAFDDRVPSPRLAAAFTGLSSADADEQERARQELVAAASGGEALAMHWLGQALRWGWWGFAPDRPRARQWTQLAAEVGLFAAQTELGLDYLAGWGGPADNASAAALFLRALGEVPDPELVRRDQKKESRDDREVTPDEVAARARAHWGLGWVAQVARRPEESAGHFLTAHELGLDVATAEVAVGRYFGLGERPDAVAAREAWAERDSRWLQLVGAPSFAGAPVVTTEMVRAAAKEREEAVHQAVAAIWAHLRHPLVRIERSVNENRAEELQWLRRAAEAGHRWAVAQRGLLEAAGARDAATGTAAVAIWQKEVDEQSWPQVQALTNLAIALQRGWGAAADTAAAQALATPHRDRSWGLELVARGVEVEGWMDTETEERWLREWAENRKDAEAQLRWGVAWEEGIWAEADDSRARYWLDAAYRQGSLEAGHRLAAAKLGIHSWASRFQMEDLFNEGSAILRAVADQGYVPAQLWLGERLYRGLGKDSSWEEAVQWLQRVLETEPGNGLALAHLGRLYYRWSMQASSQKRAGRAAAFAEQAEFYARKAIAAGEMSANELLGVLLLNRDEVPDRAVVEPLLRRAADAGVRDAQFSLGKLLERTAEHKADYEAALFYYRLAASNRVVGALARCLSLKTRNLVGEPTVAWELTMAQRLLEAGDWSLGPVVGDYYMRAGLYQKAFALWTDLHEADGGLWKATASERLSRCYEQGLGVKPNPRKGRKCLEEAAELGDALARLRLAHRLLKEENVEEGVMMMHRAALGSADAAYSLGQMYYFGQYVETDLVKAADFMLRASLENHAGALYFLAAMAAKGDAGAPSLAEGIDYAERAQTLGQARAADVLEILQRRQAEAETETPVGAP